MKSSHAKFLVENRWLPQGYGNLEPWQLDALVKCGRAREKADIGGFCFLLGPWESHDFYGAIRPVIAGVLDMQGVVYCSDSRDTGLGGRGWHSTDHTGRGPEYGVEGRALCDQSSLEHQCALMDPDRSMRLMYPSGIRTVRAPSDT